MVAASTQRITAATRKDEVVWAGLRDQLIRWENGATNYFPLPVEEMDVHMPVCDGLEATKMIKAQWPDIRIVMLTVSAEESQLYDALRFGASGYLLKSTSNKEFFKMLRDAIRGESVLTPEMTSKLLTQFAKDLDDVPRPELAEKTTPSQADLSSAEG